MDLRDPSVGASRDKGCVGAWPHHFDDKAVEPSGSGQFPVSPCFGPPSAHSSEFTAGLSLTMGLVKVRDLLRLVEADGWRHVRTTGSHRHFKHESRPNVVTIPGHPGDDVPPGTLRSILKAAGLEKKQ